MEGRLNLSNELISDAYNLSLQLTHTHDQYLVTSSDDGAGTSIVAIKGSMVVQDFFNNGETNVDVDLFPSLQRIGEGLPAKVNASLLQKFKDLLNNSRFKSEVERILKDGKKILFTGHSGGGAMASLATLLVLDEYKRKQKLEFQIHCLTFGSPLIGDGTISHAVRRQKWAGHFTHFVMERDVVPRMMLAPKTSVQEHLETVNTITIDHDHLVDGNQVTGFFENVLINASTVVSHDAFDLMDPANPMREKLPSDFVKVSIYRPFGVYVFCTRGEASSPRQKLVVENPNAVLQLMFYFLQLPNEHEDLAEFALESLNEHFSYGEQLNNESAAYLRDLNKDLLTSAGISGEAVRTSNKALFELGASAKWCLLAAEEAEKRKKEKENEIKESMRNHRSNTTRSKPKVIEELIDQLRKNIEEHSNGATNYYESFKLQNEHVDFEANMNRLEQAKIWDVVVEMVMRKDLPDDFEAWDELVDLGTQFRRLYEPLDIANYYRHDKGSGYLEFRPKRYRFTQRWYEHANVTGFEKVSESNFVAEVEDLLKEVTKPKNMTVEEVKNKLQSIKRKVENWKFDEKIQNADVFWGESILSKLEELLALGFDTVCEFVG